MSKGETIAYAIQKECCQYSLSEWCENWEITVDDFDRFIELGKTHFDLEEARDRNYYE